MWNPFRRKPPEPETRASVLDYGTWDRPVAWPSEAAAITAHTAEGVSAVLAAVSAIASGIGSLPVYAYRTVDGKRKELERGPLARLLRQPCEHMSWPSWVEMMLSQCLLHGNAYAIIETDGRSAVTGLRPVPTTSVGPVFLPSGRLAFDITPHSPPGGPPGRKLAREVFHLRDTSFDGFLGRSRLSRCPGPVREAIQAQQFAIALWENQLTSSAAIELPPNISPDGFKRMKASFQQRYQGVQNARVPVFLDAGSKLTPLETTPEDGEFLETRKLLVVEIARIFNVPPPLLQDYSHSTFTNSAQASLWFAQNTLVPWVRKLEAEFGRSVIADPALCIEIDVSGLTRGDYATRWDANVKAVQAGILTVDEVRDAEGWGPMEADPSVPLGPEPAGAADSMAGQGSEAVA